MINFYAELPKSKLFGFWNQLFKFLFTSLNLAFYIFSIEEAVETKQETVQRGLWCCSICTFDNDESMSACEICGVLRYPLVNVRNNNDTKTGTNE